MRHNFAKGDIIVSWFVEGKEAVNLEVKQHHKLVSVRGGNLSQLTPSSINVQT